MRGALKGTLSVVTSPEDLSLPEWFQERVLSPIFEIVEPRTDRRLTCVTDEELKDWTARTDDLAFVMPPMDFDGLQAVADAQRHMPPKSTWIAPKLRIP